MISTSELRKAMRATAAEKGDFTLFGLFLRVTQPDLFIFRAKRAA